MTTRRKAALMWSGGKDSALALHAARRDHPDLDLVTLVTCLSQAFDRVSMHGVRRALIEDQADALGLPVRFVVIPSPPSPDCPMAHTGPGTAFPPNDVYSAAVLAAFAALKAEGVDVIVFGDIYLEDLRAYRDRLLAHAGLAGVYPLWGRDVGALFDEFVNAGFAAVTVCVDTARLTEAHLGVPLDRAFRSSLPPGVDVCGERGEYHSFAIDGPVFRRPVRFSVGGVHQQLPFAFRELFPAAGPEACGGSRPSANSVPVWRRIRPGLKVLTGQNHTSTPAITRHARPPPAAHRRSAVRCEINGPAAPRQETSHSLSQNKSDSIRSASKAANARA